MSKGGARPGAGRKPVDPSDKKVSLTFSVPAYIYGKAQKLRAKGYPLNALISEAVWDAYYAELNGNAHRALILIKPDGFEKVM